MAEITKQITINNRLGLHARPATKFVETANKFQSDITVIRNGQEVNGKSIMGMLMLGAECGAEMVIKAVGNDAADAINALVNLIASKFGED